MLLAVYSFGCRALHGHSVHGDSLRLRLCDQIQKQKLKRVNEAIVLRVGGVIFE